MTKPKPEKANQDNNRKVIAFTIHPELLNGLDTEAAKLKISRSEVVNRILLAHFDPKPPQVNQSDFKAMQATVEQISEAVNKLLSERSLSESTPSVQKPLIDTPAPPADAFEQALAALNADPEMTPRLSLAPCLADWLDMPFSYFGFALANELQLLALPETKNNWDPSAASQLSKLYGDHLINLLLSRKTKLTNKTFQELLGYEEQARRCHLLYELLGIE